LVCEDAEMTPNWAVQMALRLLDWSVKMPK
jgi:hypothetical protein